MQQTPQKTSGPERRHLTVMFCDLVGSTALSRQLDPEELREVIHGFQDACTAVIARFDGFVSRYMGDGILVLFGYPRAHEDDAERGVRAGLGIIDAIADLNAAPDRAIQVELGVRVGIASGLVVAGDLIGEGVAAREEAIVGETPNLAARLQGLDQPNTVVIAAGTKRLVGELFEYDDLGMHELRGFSEPVQAWRVVAERSRAQASTTRERPPLVGREEEIGLLLKRWAQANDGEGQVVLLAGEAGIGKSRIVQGFRDRLQQAPDTYSPVLYYGSPHHQHSAFHPVIDQLEQVLRFASNDSPRERLDKLEAVLSDLSLPVQGFAPALAPLLSLSAEGHYPTLALGPEELRKKTLESLIGLVEAMASRQPVLMVVEDAHWIDPSTLELLSLLIERLQSTCFLLLCVSRPEFQAPWSGFTHVTALALNRLSRKESAQLVTKVAKDKALPDEVVGEIVAKTDGVPLFVEELTKTVLESDLLKNVGDRYILSGPLPSLAIPTSLHDSLMARLDHLGSMKEVAQTGAVIGRDFSHGLIAQVLDLSDSELKDAIDRLLQSKLVHRLATPHTTYSFKHALVQKVAYESLLRSRRKQLHARIAQVLLEQYPDAAETEPELLAHHFTEATMYDTAVNYWQKAGKREAEIWANNEAVRHFNNGLDLLKHLPDTPVRRKQELEIQLSLGDTLRAAKGTAASETADAYRRARELSEQLGDIDSLTHALDGECASYFEAARLAQAHEAAQRLLEVGQDRHDTTARVVGHEAVGVCSFALGKLELARTHLEEALDYGERIPKGSSITVAQFPYTSLLYLSWTLFILGYPDQAVSRCSEALAKAQQASPLNLALTLGNSCYLYQFYRDRTAVQERAEELVPLATDKGFPVWLGVGNFFRGWALAEGEEIGQGIDLMRQALPHVEDIEAPYFYALMAEACGKAGQIAEAQNLVGEAQTRVEKTGEQWYQAELHRLAGELLLSLPNPDQMEIEACFRRALEVARTQSARMWELRAAMSLSHLWQNQGKEREARELLTPIYNGFTERLGVADLKRAQRLFEGT